MKTIIFLATLPAAAFAADDPVVCAGARAKLGATAGRAALVLFIDAKETSAAALDDYGTLHAQADDRGADACLTAVASGLSDVQAQDLTADRWITAPALGDPDGARTRRAGAKRLPWFVVYDKTGRPRHSAPAAGVEAMRRELNRYLDKPVVVAFNPVDEMLVVVKESTPRQLYKGTTYYFCEAAVHNGRDTRAEFIADPERYARRTREYEARQAKRTQPAQNQGVVLYVCPMRCAPPQRGPGRCPKCGMALQAEKGR